VLGPQRNDGATKSLGELTENFSKYIDEHQQQLDSANSYCGGGVNASLELTIYLVERFCGHEIAIQTAKVLLIETRRAWQSGLEYFIDIFVASLNYPIAPPQFAVLIVACWASRIWGKACWI